MAIMTCTFSSKSMLGNVTFNAIIPTNFDNTLTPNVNPYEKIKPFKTLYLLHGMSGDYTDWLTRTNIARYAEGKNLAVIMPSGLNRFYTDDHITQNFSTYVGEELVNATRAMFNLSKKREDTFIGGLSMGGYGAIRNGLTFNKTFSKIVGLSSAIFDEEFLSAENGDINTPDHKILLESIFGDLNNYMGSEHDLFALAEKYAKDTNMFISCGSEDFLIKPNRRYAKLLEKLKADYTYEEAPGEHTWDYWDTHIQRAISWLLA